MDANAIASTIGKVTAYACLFPIALLLLWLSVKLARESRTVETSWRRVTAKASEASSEENKITLEWFWKEDPVRRDFDRKGAFSDVKAGDALRVWVNPADLSQVRPATFGELWGPVIVTSGFAALLIGAGFLVMRFVGGDSAGMPPGFPMGPLHAEASRVTATPDAAPVDDGQPIEMRESSDLWKANVFWGLLFGLLFTLPPLLTFSASDPGLWKRLLSIGAGFAWMVFMGRIALQNRSRVIRCDQSEILVSQPFGSRRIPLSEIKKVTRRDIREHLRKAAESSRRRGGIDEGNTLGPKVIYILYDAAGKRVLDVDSGMQPSREMGRFLDRMKALIGGSIPDE
jgi:hypothetical protein